MQIDGINAETLAEYGVNAVAYRDDVYVTHTPETAEIVGDPGEWAEVVEEIWGDSDQPDGYMLRYWGTDTPFEMDREEFMRRVTHVSIHECECGAVMGYSSNLCHPYA